MVSRSNLSLLIWRALTLKNRTPVVRPTRKNKQATRLGNAKGNLLKSSKLPNTWGYFLAGFANAPPNAGPKMLPIVHTKGMILKALGWSSLKGTISATVVLMIPTFPLLIPANDLATMAHARFREKPKKRLAVMVHNMPSMMTGFRPNLSEALPHAIPVKHWLREKVAERRPAHFATSFLGTLKLSIISGCIFISDG